MSDAEVIRFLREEFPEAWPEEITDVLWLASQGFFAAGSPYASDTARRDEGRDDSRAPSAAIERQTRAGNSPFKGRSRSDNRRTKGEVENVRDDQEEDEPGADLTLASDSAEDQSYTRWPGRPGLSLRAPAARALPGARALSKALRPFRKLVPSRREQSIDEELTAADIAQHGIWKPVMRSARVRHFEIALVIDESASMVIWHDTLRELRLLLQQLGGFRDVRVWWIETSRADRVSLSTRPAGPARNPRELIAPNGDRVVLVASDCVGQAWEGRGAWDVLTEWGWHQPVAILQLLPQRHWARTALSPAHGVTHVHVGSSGAAKPNRALTRKLSRAPRGAVVPPGVPIPVLTAQAELFAVWARLLHSTGVPEVPAVIRCDPESADPTKFSAETAAGLAREARTRGSEPAAASNATQLSASPQYNPLDPIREFRAASTPLAFRLAKLFSATPLRLPVMRVVQSALLPQSDQTHLAEFFLSGLIFRQTSLSQTDPDRIDYGFLPGVREVLLDSTDLADAVNVQRAVSDFMRDRFGQTLDFDAILATPEDIGDLRVGVVDGVVARVSADVLRRLGGRYAKAADRLRALGRASRAKPQGRPIKPGGSFAGTRILWVDDQPKKNKQYVAELVAKGALISEARDSVETEASLRSESFDAVISDLHLADDPLAGLDLLDRLRASDNWIPVGLFGPGARLVRLQARDKGAVACSETFGEVRDALAKELQRRRTAGPPPVPALLPARAERAVLKFLASLALDTVYLKELDVTRSLVKWMNYRESRENRLTTHEMLREQERVWTIVWDRLVSDFNKSFVDGSLWQIVAKVVALGMDASAVEIFSLNEESFAVLAASIRPGVASDFDVGRRGIPRSESLRYFPVDGRGFSRDSGKAFESDVVYSVVGPPPDKMQIVVHVGAPPRHAFTSRQLLWLQMLAGSALRCTDKPQPAAPSAIKSISPGSIKPTLGGVQIPRDLHQTHFQMIGMSDAGKQSAIRELVQTACAAGDRAVLFGPASDFAGRIFNANRGDVILNPVFSDSRAWDLSGEMSAHGMLDADVLGKWLVPQLSGLEAKEWAVEVPQSILTAIITKAWEQRASLAEVWRLLASVSDSELAQYLADTDARHLSSSPHLGEIRRMTLRQPAVVALGEVAGRGSEGLSIRNWMHSGRGVLFVPYEARHWESLGPLMAVWLLLAIRAAADMNKTASRTWIIVSEAEALGTIGRSDELATMLQALSRRDTGTFVFGYETIGGMVSRYGKYLNPILECCQHRAIFKCSGETARFASEQIGPCTVKKPSVTRTTNWLRLPKVETTEAGLTGPALLPSEFDQLKYSEAYLKFAVSDECWRVSFSD